MLSLLKFKTSPLTTLGLRHLKLGTPQRIRQAWKDSIPRPVKNLLPVSMYGGECTVTLLTGTDTMGRHGDLYVRSLIESTGAAISFESIPESMEPMEFLLSVNRNRFAVNVNPSSNAEQKTKYLRINNELDLYASVTKVFTVEGFNCRFPNVNIILISQNNYGDYSKLEYEPVDGVVETLRVCTEESIRRFAHFAFNYAKEKCRKKIHFAHKRTSMPLADGMFIDIAKEVHSSHFSEFELDFPSIDYMASELALNPDRFDVICSTEQCGTLLMSMASSVCGGAGLFSMKEMGDHHRIFKPLQTRLSITSTMELSPYGIVMCCVDLLEQLGHVECAKILYQEMLCTMAAGIKTKEFGGHDNASFVICNIVNNMNLKNSKKCGHNAPLVIKDLE